MSVYIRHELHGEGKVTQRIVICFMSVQTQYSYSTKAYSVHTYTTIRKSVPVGLWLATVVLIASFVLRPIGGPRVRTYKGAICRPGRHARPVPLCLCMCTHTVPYVPRKHGVHLCRGTRSRTHESGEIEMYESLVNLTHMGQLSLV
jgi:hypothetical protein